MDSKGNIFRNIDPYIYDTATDIGVLIVHDSFKETQPKMNKYYEIEKRRKQLKSNIKNKIDKEIQLQTKTNSHNNDRKTDSNLILIKFFDEY